jgi:multicomponent Na+:H+ antiporter subunit G
MLEIISVVLLIIGAAFMVMAGLGLLRMPDIYLRMSASTKAATLGVGAVLLAAAVYFNTPGITARALATILFVLLTAPVSAHMIGRAAHAKGHRLWSKSVMDDLHDHRSTQEMLAVSEPLVAHSPVLPSINGHLLETEPQF